MSAVGYAFMLIGGLFYFLGGFGIYRMPDVYNRIQAGTKATTLGTFSLLLGVGLANPVWIVKVILIIVFIAITNPVGSSVLTRAAYLSGVKPYRTAVDELADLYKQPEKRGVEDAVKRAS